MKLLIIVFTLSHINRIDLPNKVSSRAVVRVINEPPISIVWIQRFPYHVQLIM